MVIVTIIMQLKLQNVYVGGVSESSGPGSSPGRGHCVVFSAWARHFTLTVPLSTQVYKWVPASLMQGVTLRRTSIPSREYRNTSRRFILQKPG